MDQSMSDWSASITPLIVVRFRMGAGGSGSVAMPYSLTVAPRNGSPLQRCLLAAVAPGPKRAVRPTVLAAIVSQGRGYVVGIRRGGIHVRSTTRTLAFVAESDGGSPWPEESSM